MPRILGVDIPNERAISVSLTYLYGVGPKTARELCHKAGIVPNKPARDVAEDELGRLAALLDALRCRRPVATTTGSTGVDLVPAGNSFVFVEAQVLVFHGLSLEIQISFVQQSASVVITINA